MVLGELDHKRQQRELKSAFAKAAVSFSVDEKQNMYEIVSGLKEVGEQGNTSKAIATSFDGSKVRVAYTSYHVEERWFAAGVDRLVAVEYRKRLANGREVNGAHIILPTDTGVMIAKIYDTQDPNISFTEMAPIAPADYVKRLVGDSVGISGTPTGRVLDVTVSIFKKGSLEAEEPVNQPVPLRRTRPSYLTVVR